MDTVRILGVEITDITEPEALALMTRLAECRERTSVLYYVNAHTLNCAAEDPAYRELLGRADVVFGDGTGVRWAARMQGIRLKANLNGTDLTPGLFRHGAGLGLSYYLLGATPTTIEGAAAFCRREWKGWELVGYHHGYVDGASDAVVEDIRRARPSVLLVGMGNPKQEQWIDAHRDELDVPLVTGVGGLFDYWGGNIARAPAWMRRMGVEFLYLIMQQPAKARRHFIGDPIYLFRAAREQVAAGRR